ncbi:Mu transposase C-terminal domain-containing protein [Herbaspirillum camelliae]|uniref:Mu transposase C-terminal domain-containing protein n=1 Tax=Herbaspirillum camelliae TaxID=1892903 RepID=UPI0009F8C60B|nr:Mu transposase C-terminal domain-containing protein [Herbaspirillum camelliae]
MKNYIFKVGALITIKQQRFRIARIIVDGRVQLEAEVDGTLSNTTCEELLKHYAERNLRFSDSHSDNEPGSISLGRPLSTFSQPVQQNAIRKKAYLDFIQNQGRFVSTPRTLQIHIEECARRLGDPTPPSPITVYRWNRELAMHQGDYRSLIARHDRKGGHGCRLHQDVREILTAVIDEVYLSEQRNSGDMVHAEVITRINKWNEFQQRNRRLAIPSRATIYRALSNLDRYDEMAARFGKRIADMKFRTSGLGELQMRILQRVEIDHTPLDLFVIDETTDLPQGRPTVTLAIDAYSKMPVGMHIGFSGPSIEAVFACIRHALLPKTYVKDAYPEIENDWPCYGHIETLVCDNGLEFHSHELERVALELGTQIVFCPKRQAYYKGSIERFLKSLNFQFARMLPGHSFAKWFHREDYDPLKDAVITFDQMMRYLHRWLIDVYAQRLHRGINSSPYRKWSENALQEPPRLIADLDRLDITLGRSCERTLFHYGIELHNLRYNDPALLAIRRQLGEQVKVQIRYYFDDISLIHVIDPITQNAIPVPALDQAYARGLSIEQHRLICARAREINKGAINTSSIARAKSEIREITHELSLSKLQRKRQRAAKLQGVKQTQKKESTATQNIPAAGIENSPPLSLQVDSKELPDMGSLTFSRVPKSAEL